MYGRRLPPARVRIIRLTELGKCALDAALERTREQNSPTAPVPPSAKAHCADSSDHLLLPTQYRMYNVAVERRDRAEELGIHSVLSRDRDIAWHQGVRRAARKRKL